MEVKFDQINILTHNPSRLYSFLSFIFDLESGENSNTESVYVVVDGVRLNLLQTEKKTLDKNLIFSLSTKSADELAELAQMLEFYAYKESSRKPRYSLSKSSLSFVDPDGRHWEVKLQIPNHQEVSESISRFSPLEM